MAEVAIPIIALGSLYIASNKNKEPKSSNSNVYKKEGFQNEYKGGKIRPGNVGANEEASNVPVVGKVKYYEKIIIIHQKVIINFIKKMVLLKLIRLQKINHVLVILYH